ncbi:MAG TPA: amino acid adenylation domain-containing protein, partial [Candidatus Polarisedimenticolia bacterium]|nr:amino acid adenylation domain-containing protein [Candidatus Polarisedimenticolia bacterium]
QLQKTDVSRTAFIGEAPLLPMQEWFFEQDFDAASHWNMAVALETRESLDPDAARRAAAALLEHHDLLRARFERGPSGWRQVIAAPDAEEAEVPWVEIGPGEDREAAVTRCARLLSESLDLSRSPVIAFGIVADAARCKTTLVLVGHHLVLDGVSLRLLAEDFERVYRQIRRGGPIELPPRTETAAAWARALLETVHSGRLDDQAEPWLRTVSFDPVPLPLRGSAVAVEETTSYHEVELEPQEFEALQRAALAAGEGMENVLLAAVAAACASWTGTRSLWVELEGHGRDLLPDLDISRTVGWFTQIRPVLIDRIDALDFAATLQVVRGAAGRASGDGFEALRRHSPRPEMREALGRIPTPPISFNYLGRFDTLLGEDSLFGSLREPSSPQRSPRARRTHALEIDASVVGGRLSVRWATSRTQIDEITAQRLTDDFRRALSGFAAQLAPRGEIEEMLPLTPMQEGMLFHHLREPGKDPYVSQIALELTGEVDPEILGRAWQLAFDRHSALRAGFEWEGRERPVQWIRREVALPVRLRSEPEENLEAILAEARASGFDLHRPPLARIDLIRTRPDRLVCAFTHHHILLDGWSLPLTLQTVFDLYESLVSGSAPPPSRSSALRHYAEWLAAGDVGDAERYFRGCLERFVSPTPLPDPGGTRAAGEESRVVDEDGPPDAARRSACLGLTTGTLIQAAWALVLSASSGERDVLFGATSSGRPPSVAGIQSLVGLCINTLPVRASIDPRTRALDWMRSLQKTGAELRQFEYAPLALVQRCAPISPGAPLFDSVLVFENYPVDLAALGRRKHFEVASVHLHEETNYPLTIVAEHSGGLRFRAVYRISRYDEPSARAILRRLTTAMEDLLSHPDAPLGEISVLPEAERRRVVVEWNETRRPYPREAGIPEVFERAARNREDEVALSFKGGAMTYGELGRRSLAIAGALRARGIGPDSRVALAMERSPELFVAMLGVLRAGGAYVPVDPESPPERTRRLLEQAGTSLLVSDGRIPLAEGARGVVSCADLHTGAPEPAPFPASGPDSLAYIMFTSGSTGEPKGVEVTHRNILRLVLGTEYARFGPEQTVLQIAPVAFDASTLEIWAALLHGGRLVIPPPGMVSASEIARLLRDHAVTIAEFPTGLFHLVVDEEMASLAAIPQVIVGGDVMDPSRLRRLLAAGCRRVVNAYGPTETATLACCEVLGEADLVGDRVPIGRPAANARVYVLDERMAPVPIGSPGELFIGGDGVARGYSRRADLTAERFVPDPFERSGLRLYRTGDIVRWRQDGRLEFLGRRDGQVKVRGFRVEMGEVEKALARMPGVREAAVTARPDGEATGLVGYLVWTDPKAGDLAALRRALAGSLPAYMIPSRFVVLEALPVNANGKVDRRGLPAPSAAIPKVRPARPLTPVEEAVADLWRRALRVEGIGPDDDFFELGGHSLHAVRLLAALRRAFRVELPMTAFYETATVAGVARALIAHQPADGHVERAARALARMRAMTPAAAREMLAGRADQVRTP